MCGFNGRPRSTLINRNSYVVITFDKRGKTTSINSSSSHCRINCKQCASDYLRRILWHPFSSFTLRDTGVVTTIRKTRENRPRLPSDQCERFNIVLLIGLCDTKGKDSCTMSELESDSNNIYCVTVVIGVSGVWYGKNAIVLTSRQDNKPLITFSLV